jgi:predicted DNA-binding antitoxin AbrB/MazE fold protein
MTHIVEAIYDHGVFRPTVPLAIPEGTRVQLRVEEENETTESAEHANGDGPSLYERLKDVVGSIDDLPEDSSENLDHYLYGQPKR